MGKRKHFILIISVLLTLVASLDVFAQNFSKDMAAMIKAYDDAKRYELKITYRMFASEKAARPEIEKSAVVSRLNHSFSQRFYGETELVSNERYLLFINHQERIIAVREADGNKKASSFMSAGGLDSLLNVSVANFTYRKEGALGVYHLTYPKGASPAEGDVYFDPASFLIQKIVFKYQASSLTDGQRPKLEIVLAHNFSAKINPEDFNEKRFITVQGAQITPAPALRTYNVINLLPAKK